VDQSHSELRLGVERLRGIVAKVAYYKRSGDVDPRSETFSDGKAAYLPPLK